MIALIYRAMLRCYPRRFRQQFGNEMLEIFMENYSYATSGKAAHLVLRELLQFPQSLIREHLYERTRQVGSPTAQKSRQDALIARWIVRIAGAIIGGFLTLVTLLGSSGLLLKLGMMLLFLSLMSAWRWERTGGRLVIGSAIIVAALNVASTPNMALMGIMMVGSALLAVPFLLFGWFFYHIGSLERGTQLI